MCGGARPDSVYVVFIVPQYAFITVFFVLIHLSLDMYVICLIGNQYLVFFVDVGGMSRYVL
jgi:hypothetical protein